MNSRIPTLLLLIAFLLVPAVPASASEEVPLSSFVDRVDVNVVNVEIFVTDRKGRRITGLVREDFELYEDGRPVEITNFYTMEGPSGGGGEPVTATTAATAETPLPAAASPQQVPEEQKLSLLVFVDHFNILPTRRVPVLRALEAFLDERLTQGDRVMLVGYSGGIEVVQPFTEDRRLIAQGITKLGRTVALRSSQRTADHLASRWAEMDRHEGVASGHLHEVGRRQEAHTILLSSIDALEDVVRFLGTQSGRRALLYVSDGPPTKGVDQSTRHLFRRIPRMANAHLVTFYALDSRGPRDETLSVEYDRTEINDGRGPVGGDQRTVTEASSDWTIEESLISMAAPTGGAAFSGTANFAESLRRLGEDFNTFYSLGYASPSSGEVQFHKIKVKVRRKGLKVRHRGGYLEKPLAERVADRFLASVLLGQDKNPLGIQLAIGEPDESGSDKYELPILIKIPSGVVTFLPGEDVLEGRLRIYLAVQNQNSKLSLVRELPYPLSVPASEMEKTLEGDIGYQTSLRIGPGALKIGVGVWDEISGSESFIFKAVAGGAPQGANGDGS
ncbi:MAG: VWA domain-containing protein [bacterium]|nr:VWA domain-containing protein [bacterium]